MADITIYEVPMCLQLIAKEYENDSDEKCCG